MIEVKLQFTTLAAAAAALVAMDKAGAAPATHSATVTPDKQDAARESAQAGTALNADARSEATGKGGKGKKADAPAPAPAPEPPAVTYETSGLPQLIAEAQAKNKAALVALLKEHGGVTPEGKPSGKALKPEAFEAFREGIQALLKDDDGDMA